VQSGGAPSPPTRAPGGRASSDPAGAARPPGSTSVEEARAEMRDTRDSASADAAVSLASATASAERDGAERQGDPDRFGMIAGDAPVASSVSSGKGPDDGPGSGPGGGSGGGGVPVPSVDRSPAETSQPERDRSKVSES
ncbi:hypothetical protein OY671_008555, partial [Metschnikowia pulcherrima]